MSGFILTPREPDGLPIDMTGVLPELSLIHI